MKFHWEVLKSSSSSTAYLITPLTTIKLKRKVISHWGFTKNSYNVIRTSNLNRMSCLPIMATNLLWNKQCLAMPSLYREHGLTEMVQFIGKKIVLYPPMRNKSPRTAKWLHGTRRSHNYLRCCGLLQICNEISTFLWLFETRENHLCSRYVLHRKVHKCQNPRIETSKVSESKNWNRQTSW